MSHFVQTYGAWVVAAMLFVESLGIPVPGETTLVTAAILVGAHQTESLWPVIAAGVVGAAVGSIVGFWLGRSLGYRLVIRYGRYIRLTEARLKIGQFLFRKYGLGILIVCRFVPMLRSLMGILAGMNRMPVILFLLGAAVGSVVWVTCIALLAYSFGEELRHQTPAVTMLIGAVVLIVVGVIGFGIAHYETYLEAQAERELPGPLPRQ